MAEMEGRFEEIERHYKEAPRIICLCSRGNDSQLAAAWLRSKGLYAADVSRGDGRMEAEDRSHVSKASLTTLQSL